MAGEGLIILPPQLLMLYVSYFFLVVIYSQDVLIFSSFGETVSTLLNNLFL